MFLLSTEWWPTRHKNGCSLTLLTFLITYNYISYYILQIFITQLWCEKRINYKHLTLRLFPFWPCHASPDGSPAVKPTHRAYLCPEPRVSLLPQPSTTQPLHSSSGTGLNWLQLWLLPPCCQLLLGWVERVPGVAVCGGMCGVASPALCSPRTGCSNLVMLLHCSRRSALQRNVPANLIVDTDSADLQISKFLSWPRIMTGGFYANFLAPSMRLLLGLHKQPPTKICNLVSC